MNIKNNIDFTLAKADLLASTSTFTLPNESTIHILYDDLCLNNNKLLSFLINNPIHFPECNTDTLHEYLKNYILHFCNIYNISKSDEELEIYIAYATFSNSFKVTDMDNLIALGEYIMTKSYSNDDLKFMIEYVMIKTMDKYLKNHILYYDKII